MAIEFEINGETYRADKLNAFQQLHVSRKIAPLLPKLAPVFMSISKLQGKVLDNIDSIAEMLQPFADSLAELPDESAEYVFATCLSVVKRRVGENWVPIWSQAQRTLMFDDLNDLGKMLPIVTKVIVEYLGPFMTGFLSSQGEPSGTAA